MPPPQTRRHVHVGVAHRFQQLAVFVFADCALETIRGIQLPPLAKTGTPLITKVKLLRGLIRLLLSFPMIANPVRVVVSFINWLAIDQAAAF